MALLNDTSKQSDFQDPQKTLKYFLPYPRTLLFSLPPPISLLPTFSHLCLPDHAFLTLLIPNLIRAMFPNFELSSIDETLNWSLLELRLFDYLASIPYHRAIQLLNLCSSHSDLHKLAKLVLSYVPEVYFRQDLPTFNGKHFEMINDRLTLVEGAGDGLTVVTQGVPPVRGVSHFKGDRAKRPARKRPVNNFMVFRGKQQVDYDFDRLKSNRIIAFFAPEFPRLTQRERSRIISQMWKMNPQKTEWTIMAEAYNTLRDNFELAERTVPFFAQSVICDMLHLPDAQTWVHHYGFDVVNTPNAPTLHRIGPNFGPLQMAPFTVDDCVIDYRIRGYIVRQFRDSDYVPWSVRLPIHAAMINTGWGPIPRHQDPLIWLFDENDRLKVTGEEFDLSEVYTDYDPLLPLSHFTYG